MRVWKPLAERRCTSSTPRSGGPRQRGRPKAAEKSPLFRCRLHDAPRVPGLPTEPCAALVWERDRAQHLLDHGHALSGVTDEVMLGSFERAEARGAKYGAGTHCECGTERVNRRCPSCSTIEHQLGSDRIVAPTAKAAYWRKRRAEAVEKGLCSGCCKRPAKPDCWCCQECITSATDRDRRRMARRRA